MSLAPGARLGPYEIVSAIGAGGMGEVYRARDPRLNRDVAIKVLPAAFSSDPERLTRFEQEARAVAALNHPNIVAVFDIGTHQGAPYMVSEILEGETLRESIGGLPVRRAIEFAVGIARGLAAAHEKGIVHRDLKPENIFVSTDGRVKLLDFGLAKLTQAQPAADVTGLPTTPPRTTPGMVLGTTGYMSPEQVRGREADPRSDIFALGAVLYEMLSGRRAFSGDTAMDAMSATLREDPEDLPVAARHIPSGIALIVERCLEKDPAGRFKSADDVAFALEAISSSSSDVGLTAPAPTGHMRRRIAVVAAMILIAAAGAAVITTMRDPDANPLTRVSILSPESTRIVGSLALSGDGRMIVFAASKADGSSSLYVQTLDAADAKRLNGTDGASDPFLSPDDRSVGFFADQKLKRINLAEGAPQTIATALDPRGGTWSGADVIVFAPNGGDGLYRVAAGGGSVTRLTQLDPKLREVSHRWPRFLPDGKHFTFLDRMAGQEGRLVMAISSIDNPVDLVRIGSADSSPLYYNGRMLFPREGSLFAQPFDLKTLKLSGSPSAIAEDVWVSTDVDGLMALAAKNDVIAFRRAKTEERQFSWIEADGRHAGTIGPPNSNDARLSPDGRSVALVVSERLRSQVAGLWLVDLVRGATSRFTPTPQNEIRPVWSPDGSQIAYSSDRLGSFDLYLRSLNGSSDTLLQQSPLWKYSDDWSPDGKWLLYEEIDPATKRNLYVLSMNGKATPIPVARTGANEWYARFSPDSRWIAYASDESGRDEVYVQAFPFETKKYLISTDGGNEPAWKRDGRVLYYLSADNRIMRVDITIAGGMLKPAKPVALFQAALYRRSGQPVYWSFDPVADGSRFIVGTPNPGLRPSAIDLLIGGAINK